VLTSIRACALAGVLLLAPPGALLLAPPVATATAAATPAATPAVVWHAPGRATENASSSWSGYAVTGHGPYTSVSANWVQPAVDCARTPTGYSAFWVGLDGYTSSTVEQTGTEADCSSGSPVHYAWYEMYPAPPVNYDNPVAAGDVMSASVTYRGDGVFRLTLSNTTRGWTRTVSPRLPQAARGSAEVVAEAPSGTGGVLPLADFRSVVFSGATLDGASLTPAAGGLDSITMAGGGTVKARPGPLSNGRFSDTWYHE
jgi:Peptidase A4 family